MISLALLAAASAGFTGTALAQPLPTYDPSVVAIPRVGRVHTGAIVTSAGRCMTLRTFGQVEDKVASPIWPKGAARAGTIITLPDGTPVPLNKKLGIRGRFAALGEAAVPPSARRCPGRPFFIEHANQLFAWSDARELVAMSDAVLVARVNRVLSKDPQDDGMLTTIDATVEEVVRGPAYRGGQVIRLRLPSGIDAAGNWRTGTHDPLYGATGGLKRKAASERWLIFVNQGFYSEQARVRGGKRLPGHLGGSFFWRLDGERIVNEHDSEMAPDLPALRALAKRR